MEETRLFFFYLLNLTGLGETNGFSYGCKKEHCVSLGITSALQ